MTNKGWETINVNTEFNLDEITFLDGNWVLGKGWIVATDFIDWNGSGEGKTFENGFFVVDFVQLIVNKVITENAKINDLRSNGNFLDEFGKNVWNKWQGYRWRFWQKLDIFRWLRVYWGFILILFPFVI